ncbi:putative F-box protein At3g51171 [Apium graveolens]|uniref:putative F-box protein At3g51171 n=1 Tax=Apium graveolens TaxID=4045 RepID=UPI003D7A68D0
MASTSILPVEIIEIEILPRLPVKSLLRFKSVCKSWNSLISSDFFMKSVCNSDHDSLTLINLRQDDHDDGEVTAIGCINGLVFTEQYSHKFFGSYGFIIWNPATKQCLEIAAPRKQFRLCDCFSGFGFDSVANDYKCMLLPDLGSRKNNGEYTLLNFRDSLAVMCCNSKSFSGETIDIHIFNDKCDNWSKTAFGPFKFLSKVPTVCMEPWFLQCFRNGDLLFVNDDVEKLYWVDLENYTIKSLGKQGVSDGHTYSESLVFINGMKPFYEEEDRFQFFFLTTEQKREL